MGSTVRHKKAKKLDVRCKKISTISREITFSKKKITVSSRVTKVLTFSYRAITLFWPSSLCSEIYSPLLGLNTLASSSLHLETKKKRHSKEKDRTNLIRIRPIYFQFLRKIYTMVGTKGLIIVFICFCMFSVILGDDVKVIESGK